MLPRVNVYSTNLEFSYFILAFHITDVCDTAANNCAPEATCMSTGGDSFTCTCIPGYTGNGTSCTGEPVAWGINTGIIVSGGVWLIETKG